MNIPQFDQDMATLKAMQIQQNNGFHISENDVKDLEAAIDRITAYFSSVISKHKAKGA